MLFKMKRGTKVGWLLVAAAIVLSLWVIISQSVSADKIEGDFVLTDSGLEIISYNGSGGDVEVPAGVETIADGFFAGNSSIKSIVLPNSIKTLGTGAFQNCTELTNVQILGTQITEIPASCFEGCTSLVSVSMPNTVNTIGARAFANCVSLASADIKNGVSYIMPDAFEGCFSLSSFVVGAGSTEYVTINDCLYDITMTKLLMVPPAITTIKFADTCTTIGSGAFSNNQAVTSVIIPSSVTTIEAGAFSGSGISDISIPASVTSIGNQSGWNPITIYGYADSEAERFAYNSGHVFVLLGNSNNNTSNVPNTNVADEPHDMNDLQPAPQTQPQPQESTPAQNNININNTNTTPAINSTGKDPTPKTADGDIDARWFLIIGIFLAGIAVIMYSRMRKLQYVSRKNDSDLDS